jgi:hypothetical protein
MKVEEEPVFVILAGPTTEAPEGLSGNRLKACLMVPKYK